MTYEWRRLMTSQKWIAEKFTAFLARAKETGRRLGGKAVG